MEETHVNLYPKQLVLSKLFACILLLLSCVAKSQSAFIRLSADVLKGKEVQLYENQGVVHNSVHLTNFPLGSTGSINIPVISPNWPAVRVLSYGDASIEITLVQNDTIELGWETEKKSFNILRNTLLNKEVNDINDLVNNLIIDYSARGFNGRNPSKILRTADSLTAASLVQKNKYISTYQWFASADLKMISGRFSQEALIKSEFIGREVEPSHPAWRNSFHLIYENSILNNLAQGNLDVLKSKFSQAQWSIPYDWIANDSAICESLLCAWVTLKACYDLSYKQGYNLSDLFYVIKDGKSYFASNAEMMHEMTSILDFWNPRIRGNVFPDFEFKSLNDNRLIRLSKFRGKPIYVGFLPDMSTSSMLIISQFKALQKKYGKEIHFLLFIPSQDANSIDLMKNYPNLEFADNVSISIEIGKLFGRNDQAGFLLLNRKGETYQFPAEGPETDVENAFLGLMKE